MSKHTPGPWEVNPRGQTNVYQAHTERGVATTGGYQNNRMDPEALWAENVANARLVAAAPDLLEVLQACEPLWGIGVERPEYHEEIMELWDRINAVIAKATGEDA